MPLPFLVSRARVGKFGYNSLLRGFSRTHEPSVRDLYERRGVVLSQRRLAFSWRIVGRRLASLEESLAVIEGKM
ncbi:hypothetical protein SKAU_G00367310 [Synaphobranchus kaupii]|uniref:Uncharacterized protein n=1 Tax=Synaphobranchus kaupii TaxID=118154 RepID=A0A9Q1EFC5_SYNKA|nr:hypothetical protein SKAU_G00367310 [Synaphobranchus kaupii]